MSEVPQTNSAPSDEIDLAAHLRYVASGWRTWLPLTVVGAIVGLAYTMFAPPVWGARAALLMARSQGSAMGLRIPVAMGEGDPLVRLRGVLESRQATERIVAATGVTRRKLDDNLSIATDKQRDQIKLAFADRNRDLALSVVTEAVDVLNDLDSTLGLSIGRKKAQVIERNVADVRRRIASAERELEDFQRAHKVAGGATKEQDAAMSLFAMLAGAKIEETSLTRQIEAFRKALQQRAGMSDQVPTGLPIDEHVRGKLIEAELELQAAKSTLGPRSPELRALEAKVDAARSQMRTEAEKYLRAAKMDFDSDLAALLAKREAVRAQIVALERLTDELPEQLTRVGQLARELMELAAVLKELEVQGIQAKLSAELDTIAWSVLDAPYIVPVPLNKRPVRNAALGAVIGLFIGGIGVLATRRTRA